MPYSQEELLKLHENMFGDAHWNIPKNANTKSNSEKALEFYFGNKAMLAMSILSDAQAVLEYSSNKTQAMETARQYMNKAKSLLGDLSDEFKVKERKN